jgi:transposase-like protein
MNPQEQVCHNPQCWVYGRPRAGEIVIHSQKEQRYRCKRCGTTFSATRQTALYRIHHPHALVITVVTLLAYGCPVQAIVVACGLDERTVADWQRRAGRQGEGVHDSLVQAGAVTLGQVQADELRVRVVGGIVWLAMSISVTSRLWLGGAVSMTRDRALIRAALTRVAACGPVAALLLCTDGRSRASPTRDARRAVDRADGQAVHPAAGGRGGAADRARQCGSGGNDVDRDAGEGDGGGQHGLYRTAQCHLPRAACPARAAFAGDGAAGGDADGRDVAGGERLQPLHAASQSRRADTGPGGRTDRSPVDGP